MANEVYANNMEISCKAANGKSIAAFPDVCFTPPQAPPTPLGVPIPYPNTGLSKDTTKGTRTIRITRKEVMLKNKSYYKTSYGDEPGQGLAQVSAAACADAPEGIRSVPDAGCQGADARLTMPTADTGRMLISPAPSRLPRGPRTGWRRRRRRAS